MDAGRNEVDSKLDRVERKLTKLYTQATKDMQKKLDTQLKKFKKQDNEMRKKVKQKEITKSEYTDWRAKTMLTGQWYEDMLKVLTDDLVNVDQIAMSMVGDYLPTVYADAMNYGTYAIEHASLIDTGYTLYNHDTVQFLVVENPKSATSRLLPELNVPKDKKWNMSKIRSSIAQGVLQGESIPNISKRLMSVTEMDKNAAVRNARTMTTYAEAEGRFRALKRAKGMGIDVMKEWQSTLDGRTRHSHRMLDGERRELDDKFSNGLKEPSDPDGAPEEIYNCRCGIVPWFVGLDSELENIERENKLGSMSYEEWKYEKSKPEYMQQVLTDYNSQMKSLENESFFNIWYNPVTVKDYEDKRGSLEAKRQYFRDKLINDPNNAKKWQTLLDSVDRFEQQGERYLYLKVQSNTLNKQIVAKKKASGVANLITPERRGNAWKFTDRNDADSMLRSWTGETWRNLTKKEQRAVYEYTSGSGSFNRPLRGYQGNWSNFVGIGNVDLDYEGSGEDIALMTKVLGQSEMPNDIWLVRGVSMDGGCAFLGVDTSFFYGASDEDMKALIGKQVTDEAFLSCGTAVGTGFSGSMRLNIFVPQGTHCMYVEPFSAYGGGAHLNWDGYSTSSYIGGECETIIQRASYYEVTDVRKNMYGDIEVDIDVVSQAY